MKKLLAIALVVIAPSVGPLLWGQTEADIAVSFIPNYPPPLSPESSITVTFIPAYPVTATSAEQTNGAPTLSLTSTNPNITITALSSTDPAVVGALEIATGAGLTPVTTVFDLAPDGTTFDPSATLVFRYADDPLNEAAFKIFRFDGTQWNELIPQTNDTAQNFITTTLTSVSLYAIFRADNKPPRTTANVGSPNFSQSPTFVSSETLISLSSVDDLLQAGDIQGLGVKEIRASLDSGGFVVFPATFISFTFSSLSPNVSEGNHTLRFLAEDLAGNTETEQTLSVFLDISSPESALSIGSPSAQVSGEQFVSTLTPVGFSSSDKPTGGSGVSFLEFTKDTDLPAQLTASQIQAFSMNLPEGRHTISFFAEDNLQHRETVRVSTVSADGTAPQTTLSVSGPSVAHGDHTVVSAQTQFSLSAIDPVSGGVASGVDQISFRTDPAQFFQSYFMPFSLSGEDGMKQIDFFSKDKVQNTETTQSKSFELDATAPQVSLTNPSPQNQGVCRVIKGVVSVVGIVFDSHIQSWTLEAAPFQDASFGFTMISSGTTNASKPSLLALWNTSTLSGPVTLRLSAVDLVGNTSFTKVSLFVGDPELSLSISGGLLNKPSGIAVEGDGEFWVSDTNNNNLRKFSPQGSLLQTIGEKDKSSPLSFNKPKGLAIDSSGILFLCDTNNNRIVKLNAQGIFLTAFGQKGQFNKPTSIALDSKGNMYIADRNNGRVVKLNSQGHFLMDFTAASMSPTFGEDEDDFDEFDSAPFGVALDSNENVYASNEKRDEIVIFSPLGMVLKTIQAGFGKPQGLAMFQDYLYVADRNNSRIQKFDTFQLPVLAFGSHSPDQTLPAFMHKPTALATDSQGNLYLADRNNDSVKVFRFPQGQPPLLVTLEKEKEKPKEEAKKPEEKKEAEAEAEKKSEPEVAQSTSSENSSISASSQTAPPVTASTETAPSPQESQSPEGETQTPPAQTPANENAPSQAPPAQPAETSESQSSPSPAPTQPTPASSPEEKNEDGEDDEDDKKLSPASPAPSSEKKKEEEGGNSSQNPEPPAPSDPDSALHLTDENVKITPDSPRPGQNITFHIEPGGADNIELIVSDQAGNTIHQQTSGPAPLEGNRHKINLHWDSPKDLPEGQYLALIRAHKGGETQKALRTVTLESKERR